jgi:hypothetical protein
VRGTLSAAVSSQHKLQTLHLLVWYGMACCCLVSRPNKHRKQDRPRDGQNKFERYGKFYGFTVVLCSSQLYRHCAYSPQTLDFPLVSTTKHTEPQLSPLGIHPPCTTPCTSNCINFAHKPEKYVARSKLEMTGGEHRVNPQLSRGGLLQCTVSSPTDVALHILAPVPGVTTELE